MMAMVSGVREYWLKAGGIVALGVAVFFVALIALTDRRGLLYRLASQYVSLIDRRLRAMFLPPVGARIAGAQVAVIAAIGAVLAFVAIPSWYVYVAVVVVGPLLYLDNRKRKRTTRLDAQLDMFGLAFANALRTIPNVAAAFQSVVETTASPLREEVDLCSRELQLGSGLDEVLLGMAERVGSSKLDALVAAIVIGRQTGGDLPRVLESTSETIRERARLDGVLRTKTAEPKSQMYVIGAAPIALGAGLELLSPGYFAGMTRVPVGQLLLVASGGCWLAALFLARKILAVSM